MRCSFFSLVNQLTDSFYEWPLSFMLTLNNTDNSRRQWWQTVMQSKRLVVLVNSKDTLLDSTLRISEFRFEKRMHSFLDCIINNYWMRFSMIVIIIKAKVWVICQSRRLRRITQTEALMIISIMRKPNPIIVLLCIFLSCICKDKSTHKKWSMYSSQLVSKQFSCLYAFISLRAL